MGDGRWEYIVMWNWEIGWEEEKNIERKKKGKKKNGNPSLEIGNPNKILEIGNNIYNKMK